MLENLKQILLDFYTDNQKVVLGLFAVLLVLFTGGGYVAGQQNPPPAVVVDEAITLQRAQNTGALTPAEQTELNSALGDLLTFHCPSGNASVKVDGGGLTVDCLFDEPTPVPTVGASATSAATVTNTPLPSSTLAATVTKTPLVATSTPVKSPTPCGARCPTATATVKATNTPGLTSTPDIGETPTPGATSTQVVGNCDETQWHAPIDLPGCHHHHGFNPRDAQFKTIFNIDGFDIDAWLDEHGELLQPKWSTFQENPIGAIWLYRDANPTGCIKDFEGIDPNVGDEFDCITHVLYRIHDVGPLDHLVNRFHSEAFIVRACTEGANGEVTTVCGIAAGGAQPDYGILTTPYKKDLCHIPTEPGYPNYLDSDLGQPSYRTSQIELRAGEDFIQQYWVNSNINASVAQYYPTGTNWLFNSAWLGMDLWQIFPVDLVCDKSPTISIDTIKALLASVPPTLTENRHVTFKINDITLRTHPAGPFNGTFDPYGGACDEEDNVCLPLFISANFPDGPVTFHEGAEPSECGPEVENPCIVFDFDVDTIFPAYDH